MHTYICAHTLPPQCCCTLTSGCCCHCCLWPRLPGSGTLTHYGRAYRGVSRQSSTVCTGGLPSWTYTQLCRTQQRTRLTHTHSLTLRVTHSHTDTLPTLGPPPARDKQGRGGASHAQLPHCLCYKVAGVLCAALTGCCGWPASLHIL